MYIPRFLLCSEILLSRSPFWAYAAFFLYMPIFSLFFFCFLLFFGHIRYFFYIYPFSPYFSSVSYSFLGIYIIFSIYAHFLLDFFFFLLFFGHIHYFFYICPTSTRMMKIRIKIGYTDKKSIYPTVPYKSLKSLQESKLFIPKLLNIQSFCL